jgi:outer membrane lipoprotein-sorting protein
VAKALLRPDRLSVVLVGNLAAFASQLRGVGFTTFETVEIADLDLTSASFKRTTIKAEAGQAGWGGRAGRAGEAGGAGQAGAGGVVHAFRPALSYQQSPLASRPSDKAAPEETTKAMALLDKVVAAKGGLEKLRALKSIVAKQTQVSHRAAGDSTVETTNYIEYPSHLRVESPGQVQAFDGSHVWMKDARGVHDAPDMYVREMAAGLRRDVVSLLLAAKAGSMAVRLLPDVKETEGQLSRALELSATDLNPIVLYIDPESSMIRKRVYAADAPGRPVVDEAFFDYRDVEGIQFAFRAIQKVGPTSVERLVTDVKINAPIDPALFKRPTS